MTNNTVFIPLSGQLGAGKATQVDASDVGLFAGRSISCDADGYATLSLKNKKVKVHRIVTGAPSGMEVDHINGDRLDNRRENLRVCTRAENSRNMAKLSGEHKGVCLSAPGGNLMAYICLDGVITALGRFTSQQFAADVYDAAAVRFHGEFAYLNNPGPITPQAAAYLEEYLAPRWKVTSPDGEVFLLDALRPFCEDRGLCRTSMNRVSRAKQRTYKGWACERLSNLPGRRS